jgi:ABC-type transport system involved in multi-copper enzyme maturation permease subunit
VHNEKSDSRFRFPFSNFHFPLKMNSFQLGGNAVLMRELRASLRSARPFALLAIYVAVLGAITVAQFPANQQISIERTATGENAGKQLYWTFVMMQALLIVLVLPSIASGALSQEREQRTLEPLLLTPLTPLQIVWGKAVGVLSLAGLLLLSTLPLTSLCFLLGGVSPGELVAAYAVLLGLAIFTTSIGIYCSAKWANTVKATLICYALLPFFLAFMVLFSGVGVIVAALALFAILALAVVRVWRAWGEKSSGQSTLSHRLGALWNLVLWAGLPLFLVAMLYILLADRDAGSMAFGVFAIVYLMFISQTGLQMAAREIVRAPEPAAPSRQKMRDFQDEWRQALTVSDTYLPDSRATATSATATSAAATSAAATSAAATSAAATSAAATSAAATSAAAGSTPAITGAPVIEKPPLQNSDADKETYGVAPFLSEKLNPIFAKDMRSGLLGKFAYLVRFSYIAVIGSELLLLFLAFALPVSSVNDEWAWFTGWTKFHLAALLVAGAWLGARSIAPEHEQQTLEQLLMTPLTSAQIVWGKICAVLTYTAYIFMLGMPMALLLAGVKIVSWRGALSFLAVEIVFGAFAAAWGIFCSLKLVTTRRALGVALGGAFCLIVSSLLFNNFVLSGFKILMGFDLVSQRAAQFVGALLSPIQLLSVVLAPAQAYSALPGQAGSTPNPASAALPCSLLLYGAATVALLLLTARGFGKYGREV